MIIAKDDEAKRSKIWKIVTGVTSVLIVVIAAFFIMKLFMSNPLEGSWKSDESNLTLNIKGNNSMVINLPDVLEDKDVKLKMDYTLDKEGKTITIKEDTAAMEKAAKASEGQYTEEMLQSAVGGITTTFSYSVDKEELTLTERDYGEQLIFKKQ